MGDFALNGEIRMLLELAEKLRESEHAETKNLLGLAFLKRGLHDEAISELEEAVILNPGVADFYNNLGSAYLAGARYDEAIAALERAVGLKPEYADYQNNLGVAHLKKEQCKKAMAQFQRAIGLNPHYADAHFNMALALVLNAITKEDGSPSGKYSERVVERLEKATQADPNYRNQHIARGEEFLKRYEYEKAYEAFVEGQRVAMKPAETAFIIDFYLQVIYNSKKLTSAAIWKHIRKLQEALEKYPNRADLYNHLGVAYMIMSKFLNHRAMQQFERALQINPAFERARRNQRLAEFDHKGIQLLFDAILR
jgi:tetratricopeptide (TPR) repeat protein